MWNLIPLVPDHCLSIYFTHPTLEVGFKCAKNQIFILPPNKPYTIFAFLSAKGLMKPLLAK